MRRLLPALCLCVLVGALLPAAASAVSGGGFTSVNTAVDGSGHCKNGNPNVNCNIYDGKEFVWTNGGPDTNALGPDGQYFFAVLAPGGQPNPNDGGPKNLSDDFDTFQARTFTVTNGEISAYGGSHTFAVDPTDNNEKKIRLAPYADTTNPGGVYIMAICSLADGYPVVPRSCKYDAFKVKSGAGKVQAVLSGKKYFDANKNGQFDAGEQGLKNWSITLTGTDGTNTTLTTDNQGDWSYTVPAHNPSSGTTTYTVKEVQQAGWTQTGNTVNQSVAAGGATVTLAAFTYTVTMPNDAVAAAEALNFGNFQPKPPECPPPTIGKNADGFGTATVTVQDADSGIASLVLTDSYNAGVVFPSFAFGTKDPLTVVATQVSKTDSFFFSFVATDVDGNQTTCDPVIADLLREGGSPAAQTWSGLPDFESKVTIHNPASGGINGATIDVNGVRFQMSGLGAGESRTIDVSSAMLPGTGNTISATVRGNPGGTATIMIAN
jgi:hypothetical protein